MKYFPNPLNLFECRKLEVPPPFFEYINTEFTYNLDGAINTWIEKNMKGRYFVGRITDIDKDKKVGVVLKIGFEEPKELSYFMLACPHFKYK